MEQNFIIAQGQVEKFANVAAFPTPGNPTNIYYDEAAKTFHVWDGAAYELVGAGANTGLFTPGGITNTAFVANTDDFGFVITGTGLKGLQGLDGTDDSSIAIDPTEVSINSEDGVNSSNFTAYGDGNLRLDSSIGEYEVTTIPTLDSDLATTQLLARDSVTTRLRAVENARFESLTGIVAPVNGTTVAWYVGQLYTDSVSGNQYIATTKSTDPDTNGVGSVWVAGSNNTATNLSIGTKTATTVDVNSSDGTNVTLPAATLTEAGLITAAAQTLSGDKTFVSPFTVKEGTGSGGTASAEADSFIVTGSSTNTGMSLLTAVGGNSNLYFGEAGGTGKEAFIQHVSSVSELRLGVDNSRDVRIRTTDILFQKPMSVYSAPTAGVLRFQVESDGTLNTGATPNYEALVTSDDDIPNKKYVDDSFRANYTLIKAKADLPTPSAGVITLAAGHLYEINGSIVLGTDRLVLGGDAKIIGGNAFADNIIYTGSGDMITNTDFNLSVSNLTLLANTVGSQLFNCSNAAQTKNFVVQNCLFLNSQKAGTTTGFNNVLFNIISYQTVLDGWNIDNATHLFLINQNFEESCTGTQIDISSGTFEVISIRNNVFHVNTTHTGLDINAAGVTVLGNCSIVGNSFLGTGTLATGFTSDNSDYVVKSNAGLGDFIAEASMTLSSTTANLNVAGSTWTKIAGTTTLDDGNRFTMPSNNRLTYGGLEDITVKINVALAAYYTSGAARIAEIGVYKNGVLIGSSQNGFTIYSADEPCSTNAQITMSTGDYVEVWFQKFGGAASNDYVFSFLNVQITEA